MPIESNLPIRQMPSKVTSVPLQNALMNTQGSLFQATGNVSPVPAGGAFNLSFIPSR